MKKLYYVIVILLLTALVLPSCHSSLSITKRRYTKGYFVQHQRGKHATKKDQQIASATHGTKEVISAASVAAAASRENVSQEPQHVLTASAAQREIQTLRNNPEKARAAVAGLAIKHPVKALKVATELSKAAATGDDALSLLWVVIVVILIVYLLGLLFNGFGLPSGLIHILGVIALVLLILWLLRIL